VIVAVSEAMLRNIRCSSRVCSPPDASVFLEQSQKRGVLDITIKGGRSSVSGIVATVFGSTGFLGRYVVNQFGRVGSQVIIPFRGEEKSYTHMKVMGDLGQIVPIRWDIRDRESIREALKHSNVVVNLVGRRYDTRNFKMSEVHIDGAKRIAEVAREQGVERFVHVSALDVNAPSTSDWVTTKLEGERAVRSAFPNATILRPGPFWGAQDQFLHSRASMTRFWPVYVLQNPARRLAPVFVNDVATAILSSLRTTDAVGKTFELAGPAVVSEKELAEWVARMVKIRPRYVELNDSDLENLAYWLGQHRKPRMTLDTIKRDKEDVLVSGKYPGFPELGIPQDHLQPLYSQLAVSYILSYRKPSRQVEISLDDEPEEIKQLQRDQPLRPLF
jgi:NADH dehydrogenase (ubiquinone) 1 alpha subcomplex subunit 9